MHVQPSVSLNTQWQTAKMLVCVCVCVCARDRYVCVAVSCERIIVRGFIIHPQTFLSHPKSII